MDTPSNQPITPDIVAKTPVVEPAPEKVTFTPEQQQKIDAIGREAMGRSAGEVRKENLKLRQSLEKALAASNPDASELEKTRAQLEAAKLRLEDMTTERQNALLESEITAEANAQGFCDSTQATLLLDKSGFVKEDGTLDLEAAKAAVRALANKSPHLIKGNVKSGSGSGPDQRVALPPVKLESLFGRGSSAQEANRLAIADPQRYKALRAEARKRGLI